MRTTGWRPAVVLLLVGASCSRGGAKSAKVSDELQRDLAAASSASIQLASEAQGYKPMRFVSPIEQGEHAVPVERRPAPHPVVRNTAAAESQQEKAPDPAPQTTVAVPNDPQPEQTTPAASDVPNVPVVAPRPAPVPVEYPAAGTGTRGGSGVGSGGTDLGTIIGVIIRGGAVGDDHCVPRSGPRTGGLPLPIPGGRIPRRHR